MTNDAQRRRITVDGIAVLDYVDATQARPVADDVRALAPLDLVVDVVLDRFADRWFTSDDDALTDALLARGASLVRLGHVFTLPLPRRDFAHWDTSSARWIVDGGAVTVLVAASSDDIRFELPTDVEPDVREPTSGDTSVAARCGPRAPRFVATTAEFEAMLGHPVPEPTPVLPFTLNTVIDELDATRLGRIARSGFLKIAERQMASKLGDDPDPVLVELGSRMIREAPLRFLVSMSGGAGSVTAFEGLTTLLSALRITGRGRSGRDARDGEDDADASSTGRDDP